MLPQGLTFYSQGVGLRQKLPQEIHQSVTGFSDQFKPGDCLLFAVFKPDNAESIRNRPRGVPYLSADVVAEGNGSNPRRKAERGFCQVSHGINRRAAAGKHDAGREQSAAPKFFQVRFNKLEYVGEPRFNNFLQFFARIRAATDRAALDVLGFFEWNPEAERDIVRYVVTSNREHFKRDWHIILKHDDGNRLRPNVRKHDAGHLLLARECHQARGEGGGDTHAPTKDG